MSEFSTPTSTGQRCCQKSVAKHVLKKEGGCLKVLLRNYTGVATYLCKKQCLGRVNLLQGFFEIVVIAMVRQYIFCQYIEEI